MKILRIASDLYPSVIGGAALHAHNMSMLQANIENDVTVYTVKPDDRPYEEIVGLYRIERFKPLIKFYGNPVMPSLFFRLMAEKNRFDIIHAHSHRKSVV